MKNRLIKPKICRHISRCLHTTRIPCKDGLRTFFFFKFVLKRQFHRIQSYIPLHGALVTTNNTCLVKGSLLTVTGLNKQSIGT